MKDLKKKALLIVTCVVIAFSSLSLVGCKSDEDKAMDQMKDAAKDAKDAGEDMKKELSN